MEGLSLQIIKLLDKLYNLRGKDSVVLTKLVTEKESAVSVKEENAKLIGELQNRINEINNEESILSYEGEKLRNTIASINKEEFNTVLNTLNIDFNPASISRELAENLPKTLESLNNEKYAASEKLRNAEEALNDSITKISELEIRMEEAISNQESLNNCFNMAFNSNITGTREDITSLLAKFDFSLEEQREGAKLLMFPEDSLFIYDKMSKEGKIEPKKEEVKEELIEEIVKEEKSAPVKEDLINLLTSLGFDYLDFTANDFEKMLANYNEELITKNTKLSLEKGIPTDVFLDNIDLIYDKEFTGKCEVLLNAGKEAKDIYLNPNVLVKYSLEDLNKAINLLKSSGLDPKNVPLMAY